MNNVEKRAALGIWLMAALAVSLFSSCGKSNGNSGGNQADTTKYFTCTGAYGEGTLAVQETGQGITLWFSPPGYESEMSLQGKVFRSVNLGQTWQEVAITGTYCNSMETKFFYFDSSGNMWIHNRTSGNCGNEGLYRSPDGGQTWEKIEGTLLGNPTKDIKDIWLSSFLALSNDVFVAVREGSYGGIVRSEDGGQTWTLVEDGLNLTGSSVATVGPDGTIYIGTGNPTTASDTTSNLAISRDQGLTWSTILSGIDVNDIATGPNGVVIVGASNKVSNGMNYSGLAGVYLSRDSGQTWTFYEIPEADGGIATGTPINAASLEHPQLIASPASLDQSSGFQINWNKGVMSVFIDQNGEFWVGRQSGAYNPPHPGGLSRSSDGCHWRTFNSLNGLNGDPVQRVYVSSDGTVYAFSANNNFTGEGQYRVCTAAAASLPLPE